MRELTKFEDSVLIKVFEHGDISSPAQAFLLGVGAGIAIEHTRIKNLIGDNK